MVEFDPVSDIQNSCNGKCDDFDGHCSLIELKLRSFDDVKGGKKTEIIKDPVKWEESVDNDLNESSVLVFGGFAYEFNDPWEFLYEFGESHELSGFLKMI